MPFQYTCEQCGNLFVRGARPDYHNKMRFCSPGCRYKPRPVVRNNDGTAFVLLPNDKKALISIEDADWVEQYNWSQTGNGYVVRKTKKSESARYPAVVTLSREILNAPDHLDVDHSNHDILDNRRCNLRLATVQENVWNMSKRESTATAYKGVKFVKKTKRWMARISRDYQSRYLGMFATAEEAARAYDKAALELHGEFACLNFPD